MARWGWSRTRAWGPALAAAVALVLGAGSAWAQDGPPTAGSPPAAEPPPGQPPPGQAPPSAPPQGQPPADRAGPPIGGVEPVQPPPQRHRSGFLAGGGLGLGSFSVSQNGTSSDNFGGLGYRFTFGGLINPALALAVEVWGSDSDQSSQTGIDGAHVFQRNVGVCLRYWPTELLWLEGGAGSARTGTSGTGSDQTDTGVSLLAGLAYEAVSRDNWALDLELRLTFAGYSTPSGGSGDLSSTGGALTLGFDWY